MPPPTRVVSHEEWLAARRELLREEKAFTHARDALTARRQALPWERVEKSYSFEGPPGRATLGELFAGRSQLLVYHFMFAPDWEAGCKSCSFWADNFDGIDVHLAHRDISFLAISRAPYEKLARYRERMGWRFRWFSSLGNDFNFDYDVSFTPAQIESTAQMNYAPAKPFGPETVGISVFAKDGAGAVYHTYSCYARGIDMMNGAYHYIDLTPRGRDEGDRNQFWVRRHDEYTD
jgi:predicted dithiol-disulfide oxidoreductase (DUF899 family)